MDWTLEVVVLPVSDIDRAIEFYRDKVGFELDHDTKTEHMHVVQLTPRGSGCSIVFGDLPAQQEMAAGSMRGLQLVVADAGAARQELIDRGVEASDIMQFSPRRRRHLLRVRRPGRQHRWPSRSCRPWRQATDPARASQSVRRRKSV